MAPSLLATGFVADQQKDGTLFPSAGGNSSDPKVQAVYWRCIVTLFASARINDPEQRLALFCNCQPPVVDGADIADVLRRYGVEIRIVPLRTRLPAGRTQKWGNVLYFLDILDSLADEPGDLRLAIVDSDVLVTAPLGPLFALGDKADFAGYIVESDPDEDINGLSRRQMSAIAALIAPAAQAGMIDHYGGELFMASLGGWRRDRDVFKQLVDDAIRNQGAGAAILTEEHVFSIAFSLFGDRVASAAGLIKRLWTSPRYNTVAAGDEELALWHLPAEKRHGLRDMYGWLAALGFPATMDRERFHRRAMSLCGIPRKSIGKVLRDGVRQVAARLKI